jgi:hypothetical protein
MTTGTRFQGPRRLSHGVPTAGLGLARTGRVLRPHERVTPVKVAPDDAIEADAERRSAPTRPGRMSAHGAHACLLYLQLPLTGA